MSIFKRFFNKQDKNEIAEYENSLIDIKICRETRSKEAGEKATQRIAGFNLDFEQYLKILVENKNIDVIPNLFWTLLLRDSDLKKTAVKELTKVMRNLTSKQYIYLSKKFRERTLQSYNIDWKDIDMDYLLEDYMSEDEKITVLGLASFHPNGFVREKALDELMKYDESKVMHFLLIRSCDWVVDIRKKSQDYLMNLIDIKNLKDIIRNRLLIDKIKENIDGLKVYARYRVTKLNIKHEEKYYEELNSKIENILTSSENSNIVRSALLECALSNDAYVQQYSLEKLINSDLCSLSEKINALAKVRNMIVSFRCMKLILEKLSDEEVINYKEDLEKVRGYRAQTELIKRFYESGYFKNEEMLMTHILSRYASVRDIARFYMRKMGFNDYEKIYLDNLNNPEYKKAALLGLCETCSKENKDIILKYFKDSNSKTQKKIFNKFIELSDAESCGDYNIYMQALQSGKRSVIKLSRIYMKQNSELFDKEVLYNEYQNETDKTTKDSLAEILCSGNGWTGLLYGLKLLEDSYDIAWTSIKEWINAKKLYIVKDDKSGGYKYFALSKMNKEIAAELKREMEKNGQMLDEESRKVIEGFIRYYV